MSVIPAPLPPPRQDLVTHGNPALLAKQPHHYPAYPLPLQNDRRLPLPHVPVAGAATNPRIPDLHAQNNSRSPSPRNTAITATPSTGTPGMGGPSPFSSTPVRGMNTGGSTPSTGSSSSSKRSGIHGSLPFSTTAGSTSSPNLNAGLPVVEEHSPSPLLPGSAVGGASTGGVGANRRPLPVPPPPPSRPASRNANTSGSLATHTPVGPRVNSPLRSTPARAIERGPGHTHGRSRSEVELSLDHTISSGSEKRRDSSEAGHEDPEPPDPESVPYHERSEKWKGKQKMRDLPPSPTSPRSPTSPSRERSSPVFMSSAFPTNAVQTTRRSPERSPSLPALNATYLRQQEAVTPNPNQSSGTTTAATPTISPNSGLPADQVGVDLPPSLTYKTSIPTLSSKSIVAGGGVSKRTGVRRSGSVSSIRSNSSWRSSKSGHSVSGWAGKVFGSGSSAKQEQSHSANSSPVIPGPALATPTNPNGIFNYDNNYNAYTPSSATTPNPGNQRQPPTPRLQIPTTPSFVLPPPPIPVTSHPLPSITSPGARSPLPPPPATQTASATQQPLPPPPQTPPATATANNAPSRRNTKHNKYFVANRTSMESIASLAVSVQQQQPNGSVDSFGSGSTSSGSGSGSTRTRTSRGSGATLDAPSYDNQYFASGTSHSQDSLTLSNPYSSSTGPSTPTYSYSIHEDDVGHAHEGYDVDDNRVYVDDGFDDPTKGDLEEYLGDIGIVEDDIDLDDLGEFEAAPGSPDGSDYDSSSQGGSVVGGGGLKAASASHSPLSPMTYARDDDSDNEALGGTVSTHVRHSEKGKGKDKGKGKALPDIVDDFVPARKVTRSATSASSRVRAPNRGVQPPMPTITGEVFDDPADILGGEMEMVFAKHTSSSARRERGQSYVLGLGGLGGIDEGKEFIRGKWRAKSRSPELENGVARPVGGGLRRYQSEESMGMGGGTDDEDERAQTLPAHAIEAPFRLTPNRYVHPEPLPPPPTPGMNAHPAHRIRSHQGRSSISLPHNHSNPNKPLPPNVLNFDYAAPSTGGAFVGIGGLPGPFPFLGLPTEHERKQKEQDREESRSIRSNRSSKSKSGVSVKRGLSVPGKEHGKDLGKEHVRKQLDSLGPTPTKQVSYEVWVERGLSSGPEKRKGVLTKPPQI
ncbi:hypothetical protein V5O48_006737 [Marasmius crinis-equi]|uniref:Uncharacterized protein n=1 Tax=Marasmius crinis-equi TaxID=585013 RepID=A0ABR3FIM9_9AGAR